MNHSVLEKIRGKVLVSCQGTAENGNPFYLPEHMVLMARAAAAGGCAGFRVNTPPNIKAVRAEFPHMPIIGIYKIVEDGSEVYITPNMAAVEELVSLGCEIIAMDGTNRKNAGGLYAWEFIAETKKKYPHQCVMADLATLEEARLCAGAGADILATTMVGYTEESREYRTAVNYDLVRRMREEFPERFIIVEGKLWTVEDAQKAFDSGADAVVIGTAITNPMGITRRFVTSVGKQ